MQAVDYYELLGIERSAATAEIKSAYRSLIKVVHPDAGGTAGMFRLLREAYETLSDPVRRADYDRTVDQPSTPPRAGTDTSTARRPASAHKETHHTSGSSQRRKSGPEFGSGFGEDPKFVPNTPRLDTETITWWHTIDPGQRVRYLPASGPGARRVLVAIVLWLLLLLPLTFPIGLSSLAMVLWIVLTLIAAVVVYRLVRKQLTGRRINRSFIAEFGGHRVFGRPGNDRTQLGERLTAKLLADYLCRLPGARIFHGLACPGSVFADIHHAVLCGRRLVLIESRMWLPGHYTVDDAGTLWRNGHPFRGGAVVLPESIVAYRELLPGVEVRGALLLYPSRAGEITTGEAAEFSAPPMTPERLIRQLGEWLAGQPSVLDREVFRTVLGQLVS